MFIVLCDDEVEVSEWANHDLVWLLCYQLAIWSKALLVNEMRMPPPELTSTCLMKVPKDMTISYET